MRTLYTRIVLTFVLIALASGIVGLLLTSVYYESVLRSNNERKILETTDDIVQLYRRNPDVDLGFYLDKVAALGYQIYAVLPGETEGKTFGSPFKRGKLTDEEVRSVLNGAVYRGMSEENHRLTLLAFFENSLRNTVGVPLATKEGNAALFVRPDLEKQIGEVRIIVAVLILGTFAVSLVLIVILSRAIVRPIRQLTRATNRIERGEYDVGLETSRKDEIGNLARHFSRMARSIGQLDRRRQAFVADVSHEFQTPLTSIQGFARAALEPDATEEERRRCLTVIEEESGRLSSLAKQLLTLAFLDRDDSELNKKPYRLDEQIRQILITLEWQWSEKRLRLELDLPETTVTADPELLHEVWLNLLANAFKFTDPGGAVRVKLSEEPDGAVSAAFEDTGPGIVASELPYLFERFHKADSARSRSGSGSGLGLSIAAKIAELHGGSIAVRSEPGQGSVFTVTIPRA